ncbi:MAG: TonB-dependent receptor [Gemmatimonadales bacterium]|jgi:hypothetical protein
MTERSRWAIPRLARVAAAWVAAVVLGANVLMAQGTTGKIEGTVRDQSGAPVNGAQVFIVGTAFAAVSNERGYYFINNVPAGVMVTRAQYIGYQPAEVRNVRVFAGQTMTINLTLEQRAIEVSGVTITVEQTPIVPRDQVTSKPIMQGDVIQALPVDAVSQVLRLQPGVVEGRGGALTIRGGRSGDAATYIDGVLVKSMAGRAATVSVGTNALEEASVTTGAIGAEYGEAQSGVVNLVTRAGGTRLHGNLAYGTDQPAGQVYGTGLNRIEASLGGPLAQHLTFFLATTLQGEQNGRQPKGAENVPRYVLDGIDTTVTVARTPGSPTSDSQIVNLPKFVRYSSGSRVPDGWDASAGVDAKLQYTFGSGSRIAFTYHRAQAENLNSAVAYDYNTMGRSAGWSNSNAYILNWTQNLLQSAERALFLDATVSYQNDQNLTGQINPAWAADHQQPFAFFSLSKPEFTFNFGNWPINDRLIQNIRLGNCAIGANSATPQLGGCVPYLNRNDLANSGEFRTDPYGVPGDQYPQMGLLRGGAGLSQETRWTGRANFDWQANRYNRVRFGGDFVKANTTFFGQFGGGAAGLTSTQFMDAYKENPLRFGLYASDRIDLGDVVVDLGLRYDRLDSKIKYPRVPARTFSDPIRTGDLSVAYTAADTVMAQQCGALYAAVSGTSATSADTTAWSTCNYFTAKPRGILAPSIRVSFPVTDKTGFRLSYSHQVQTPSFTQLASSNNIDLNLTNTNSFFSRDLTFGKTIMFEFGLRHAFSDDMVLDISAYNKDKVSDIAGRIIPVWDPFLGSITNLDIYTNAGFGNVRGVDVKLDRRIGQIFQGTLIYTYQSNRTTDSDPNEYLNNQSRSISAVTGDRVSPPQALMMSADNRTHTIAGNLSLNFPHGWHSGTAMGTILQDFGFNATFRFASGLPYTKIAINAGAGTVGPGNGFGSIYLGTEVMNGASMPWIKNVDLRVTRGFRVGGRDLTLFADFRNLFNFTNLSSIFAETGDVVNDKYKTAYLSSYITNLQAEAGSLWSVQNVTTNGVTTAMPVIDLTDCSKYAPTKVYGVPNCLMLRRTEQLFGNGDQKLDQNELTAAYSAFYESYSGRGAWNFYGAGLNIRFGFELNF